MKSLILNMIIFIALLGILFFMPGGIFNNLKAKRV